jgi:hypothetical protein
MLREGRILICDRDPKWTHAMEDVLSTVGVRVMRMPAAAPNCNAHAERVVRSIKEECLNRVVPFGEWHLRRLVREFVAHYHAARKGIGNALIDRPPSPPTEGAIHAVKARRNPRLLPSRRIERRDRVWDSTGSLDEILHSPSVGDRGLTGSSYAQPVTSTVTYRAARRASACTSSALASSARTSSVTTWKCVRRVSPNEVVMATSVASRPRAMTMRPIRRRLWRASKVHQRSPR